MFLGIDLGLTVIKGVLFDGKGKEIIKSSVKPKILNPKNGWYERDPKDLWDCVRKVSKDISRKVNSKEIEAIGLSGYGDGCYLLDKNHKLLDNGILSYDTRAKEIVKHWEIKGLADQALDLVGQKPFAAVVPALLLWYKRNRKEKYIQIRHLMFCKDYVRFKLTNEIYTDLSDASSCLTKVHTQKYDNQILDLFGINEAKDALPEIKNSYDVGGFVTNNASKETGLKEGTLVAIGSHDIDACACGIGAIRDNIACVIAGTWSINLLVTPKPYISPRWMCRNFVEKGKWLQQASSPASVANLEWFSKYFCKEEQEKAEKEYKSIYNICDEKIKNVETNIIYHPFLFGSPLQENASASFIGIKSSDTRNKLLRALYEGVAFNHRMHIEDLDKGIGVKMVRLTGGASRSSIWTQIFSDILNRRIEIVDKEETGCFGAAFYGAIASGKFKSVEEMQDLIHIKSEYEPKQEYDKKYEIYKESCNALTDIWNKLENI